MRSTATELGTPRTIVSSVRSSAWTPGNQVFQVASDSCARTAGRDLGPQIIRCWSAHAAAPPGCPQAYPQVWRSSRVVRPPTPRPLPNRGASGKFPTPGAGRNVGVADVTSAAENPTSPGNGRRPHRPRPKNAPQGRDPQRSQVGTTGLFHQVGTPYTAPSRRPRSDTSSRVSDRGAAPPPGPFSSGPGVRGGHA